MNRRLALLGLLALVLGSIVYLVDRPAGHLILVTEGMSLYGRTPITFGALAQVLPAFTHVFALCVLMGALTKSSRPITLAICLGWLAVDGAFEIGQHTVIARAVGNGFANLDSSSAVTRVVLDYLQAGRFDPLDMLAIGLGALAAYATIRTLSTPARAVSST